MRGGWQMGWWSRLFGGKSGSASSTGQGRAQAGQARREPAMAPVPAPVGGHPSIDERAALELREGSPEFDEFIARAELESGSNLPHGAEHLANLLIVDPAHPRWRELLQRYLAAAAQAPERLVAAGEQ